MLTYFMALAAAHALFVMIVLLAPLKCKPAFYLSLLCSFISIAAAPFLLAYFGWEITLGGILCFMLIFALVLPTAQANTVIKKPSKGKAARGKQFNQSADDTVFMPATPVFSGNDFSMDFPTLPTQDLGDNSFEAPSILGAPLAAPAAAPQQASAAPYATGSLLANAAMPTPPVPPAANPDIMATAPLFVTQANTQAQLFTNAATEQGFAPAPIQVVSPTASVVSSVPASSLTPNEIKNILHSKLHTTPGSLGGMDNFSAGIQTAEYPPASVQAAAVQAPVQAEAPAPFNPAPQAAIQAEVPTSFATAPQAPVQTAEAPALFAAAPQAATQAEAPALFATAPQAAVQAPVQPKAASDDEQADNFNLDSMINEILDDAYNKSSFDGSAPALVSAASEQPQEASYLFDEQAAAENDPLMRFDGIDEMQKELDFENVNALFSDDADTEDVKEESEQATEEAFEGIFDEVSHVLSKGQDANKIEQSIAHAIRAVGKDQFSNMRLTVVNHNSQEHLFLTSFNKIIVQDDKIIICNEGESKNEFTSQA